jgi:hypothetical protein
MPGGGGATMVRVRVRVTLAVCAGEPESVAVTVTAAEPATVGVPLMRPPVVAVRPGGSGLDVHETEGVPPVDWSWTL